MARIDSVQIGRWAWLKILVSGVIFFILLERALIATGNLNYIPSLLVVGAVTVPLAFCALLYTRTRLPEVPWLILGVCALWGGLVGTLVAGWLEYGAVVRLGVLPTLAIGVIEETAKLIVPAYFLIRSPYRHEFDGMIIGAASGAGFAALESMGYGLTALLLSRGNVTATGQVLLFRGITAPAAHIAWTGLAAGALWYAANRRNKHGSRRLIFTFVGVVLLHALWDSVISLVGYIILGLISLGWLIRRVHHAEKETAVKA
jgi:protease PrsW